jgi:hypothetical protein
LAVLPAQYSIMVIDIESFETCAPSARSAVLRQMRDVVRAAISVVGVCWEDLQGKVDLGDGTLMVPLPGNSPARIAGPVVTAIGNGLAAQARKGSTASPIRFRIALHVGPADGDLPGPSADPVTYACMLAAAQPLRDALRAAARAHVAVIASAEAYESSIRHEYPAVDPAAYLPVSIASSHQEPATAWITVPGYPAPPGIRATATPYDGAGPETEPGSSPGASGSPPAVSQHACSQGPDAVLAQEPGAGSGDGSRSDQRRNIVRTKVGSIVADKVIFGFEAPGHD